MRKILTCIAFALAVFAALPLRAEPLTVAALGDSLTQGYGLPEPEGFVPQLSEWLAAHGADVRIINAGVSGDTTAGGAARAGWTLTPEVDAMIVALGANDLLRGIDPAASRANLRQILETARASGVPVMLIGFEAPRNYGPDYKTAFDTIYPELASEFGTGYLPSFFAGLPLGKPAALEPYVQNDGLHPNAAGVKRIVAGIGPEILEWLSSVR